MNAPLTGPPPCVLVVDNKHDSADSLALLLGLWGYWAVVAYDGETALAATAAGEPVAAALIDLALPGMDGYALVSRLRAMPQLGGAVLIAATGYGREEDRRRCLEAGFHHHLLKPYDSMELRRLLPLGGVLERGPQRT